MWGGRGIRREPDPTPGDVSPCSPRTDCCSIPPGAAYGVSLCKTGIRAFYDAKRQKFFQKFLRRSQIYLLTWILTNRRAIAIPRRMCDSVCMRSWIVRLGSLYVFNVAVLLLIGWLLPGVRVGWAALWASVILTAATVWVKPAIGGWSRSLAAQRGRALSSGARKAVEYLIVFAVAWVVWLIVVLASGVSAHGVFGWVIPPVALLGAWALYDVVDDRLESTAGQVYDRASGALGGRAGTTTAAPPTRTATEQRAQQAGREELRDGLTEEQRRMFDEL